MRLTLKKCLLNCKEVTEHFELQFQILCIDKTFALINPNFNLFSVHCFVIECSHCVVEFLSNALTELIPAAFYW